MGREVHSAEALRLHGYTTVQLPPRHPAQGALQTLPDYFARAEANGKNPQTPEGILEGGLESRGYVRLSRDKQVFIVRDKGALPEAVAATEAWESLHALACTYLRQIEKDVGWPKGTLSAFVEDTPRPGETPGFTLMRMFRYDPAPTRGKPTPHLEPHLDQGLLTLVVSDVSGLWVLDRVDHTWKLPPAQIDGPILSVLVGETLEHLSNQRYRSCLHGVQAGLQHRHAIVFQLRADRRAVADSDVLTTVATGPYRHPFRETLGAFEYRTFKDVPGVNPTE